LARFDLLQDTVDFKIKFYRSVWAGYEQAKPGSLRLSPSAERVADLRKDYQNMQPQMRLPISIRRAMIFSSLAFGSGTRPI
jgi:hypothetical protein